MTDANLAYKDGNGTVQTFAVEQVTGGRFVSKQVLVDTAGNPISGGSPLPVSGPATDAQMRASPLVAGYALVTPVSSFNRPANTTPYEANDIITDSTTTSFVGGAPNFQAARVEAGAFEIYGLRLIKTSTLLTAASFRVHLFSAAPTSLAVDNAAFAAAGAANYIGSAAITMTQALSDGAFGVSLPSYGSIAHKLASGQNVFWLLEAEAAYAPASAETFTLVPEIFHAN